MEPFQQRVIEEKEQLDQSHQRLCRFINESAEFLKLPRDEQDRLRMQERIMSAYSLVLKQRIAAF